MKHKEQQVSLKKNVLTWTQQALVARLNREKEEEIELVISKFEDDSVNSLKEMEKRHQHELQMLQQTIKSGEVHLLQARNEEKVLRDQLASISELLQLKVSRPVVHA